MNEDAVRAILDHDYPAICRMPEDVLAQAALKATIELLRKHYDTKEPLDLNDIPDAPSEKLEKALNTLVPLAKTDSECAKAALLIAATYMLRHEPLPFALAIWLGGAIHTAVLTPERVSPENADTGTALLQGVYLNARHRRKKRALPFHVFDYVEKRTAKGLTLHKAAQEAARDFGISASTAKRLYKRGQANVTHMAANLLSSLRSIKHL